MSENRMVPYTLELAKLLWIEGARALVTALEKHCAGAAWCYSKDPMVLKVDEAVRELRSALFDAHMSLTTGDPPNAEEYKRFEDAARGAEEDDE